MTRNGFADGMPCQINLRIIGDMPVIKVSQDKGLSMTSQVAVDLQCRRNDDEEYFSQVFTINTNKIEFTGKLDISEQLTIKIHIDEFNLNIDSITNSKIGNVNVFVIKGLLTIMEPVLNTAINLIFS